MKFAPLEIGDSGLLRPEQEARRLVPEKKAINSTKERTEKKRYLKSIRGNKARGVDMIEGVSKEK